MTEKSGAEKGSRGLTASAAAARLAKYGANRLPVKKNKPLPLLFLAQFADWMIGILLLATAVSFFLGETAEALTILALVMLNAVLGFVQEAKTEKSIEALRAMGAPKAVVLRDGTQRELDPALLVPGDYVLLEAGNRVPADGILCTAETLETDESLLTGESHSEEKRACLPGEEPENKIGCNRRVYMGTLVTAGHGSCLVTDTGIKTQMGQIAHLLAEMKEEATPLQKRLNKLGRQLGLLCLSVCFAVALLGFLRGEAPLAMLITGISLAVAAVPEGLPAVVTVSLALATGRMLKKQALIRRLHLVETLGSATVICSDKTGTLTQNEMRVRVLLPAGGTPVALDELKTERKAKTAKSSANAARISPAAKAAQSVPGALSAAVYFCNRYVWDSTLRQDNPTEQALFCAGGALYSPSGNAKKIAERPFDSLRKRMSVLVEERGGRTLYVKGAADFLLPLCTEGLFSGQKQPLNGQSKKNLLQQAARLGSAGLRVIAFARRENAADTKEERLTFLGFAGLADPPRPETREAIEKCRRAQIRPVMITGDAKETALSVAKQIGLAVKGRVLTGAELDKMSDAALQAAQKDTEVYARVTPAHKLRIVRLMKKSGEIVAMTGDGVNDAPAVKEADIGIAMGRNGTDVTREAAGMVLQNDNFAAIVGAIEEGRAIFDNIRRFIRYLLACNLGEVLSMLLAMLFSMPPLLLPIQILVVNFVTDGLPALALGLEPPAADAMTRKPRKADASIFSDGLLWKIVLRGVLISLATLFAFTMLYGREKNLAAARTGAFVTLILTQLIHALECKSEHHSLLHIPLLSNQKLLLALLCSLTVLGLTLYVPALGALFSTCPLTPLQLLLCFGISCAVPVLSMLAEVVRSGRLQKWK